MNKKQKHKQELKNDWESLKADFNKSFGGKGFGKNTTNAGVQLIKSIFSIIICIFIIVTAISIMKGE